MDLTKPSPRAGAAFLLFAMIGMAVILACG